ncbi:MAG: hypothetical protein HY474_02320 [Candidatus Sungbacteria bacterium]|uniref:PilN domain-containing protein n=1 Tax=Candidatus Sungiibacteriota bacterium TaxID=2750080 RepID=A0A933DRR9_9BACT|nr:hypothetical protein [Candidatus Sungbacteria bacterium]
MPEPAASFIPRAEPQFAARAVREGGVWLFNFALAAFAASALAWGGLFLYQRSLASARADWEEQVAAQEAELKPDLLAQIADLTASIGVAREILNNHVYASNVLLLLQSFTHPAVSFSTMSFSRDARKIELTGLAASYRSVAEQVNFFESHPQVEKVDFGGLAVGERGLVNFRLAVIFKPSLLTAPIP